jgi:hypothetical protein
MAQMPIPAGRQSRAYRNARHGVRRAPGSVPVPWPKKYMATEAPREMLDLVDRLMPLLIAGEHPTCAALWEQYACARVASATRMAAAIASMAVSSGGIRSRRTVWCRTSALRPLAHRGERSSARAPLPRMRQDGVGGSRPTPVAASFVSEPPPAPPVGTAPGRGGARSTEPRKQDLCRDAQPTLPQNCAARSFHIAPRAAT